MMNMTTANEKRIEKYARAMAKIVIALRNEGTAWGRAEAERLQERAAARCVEMRMEGR